MNIKLLHSGCGDWEGLYINNELIMENHSIRSSELLNELKTKLGFDFENVWDNKEDCLDRYGNSCPKIWPHDLP